MTNNRTNKPWGYEDLWAKTDKYVGKLIHIKNGESLSLQYHNNKEETVRVVKGRLYVEFQRINDGGQKVHEYYVLRVGESLHVPPRQVQRFYAEAGPVDIIEVSTPELDDVVRLEDKYGRGPTDEELESMWAEIREDVPYSGPVS